MKTLDKFTYMKITPFILGSGRAAKAIERSLCILNTSGEGWQISPATYLKRGQPIPSVSQMRDLPNPILCITNPSGLHARALLEGQHAGFPLMVVEKPACVNMEQVTALKEITAQTAVCHVYRQTWGVQTLKKMITAGELGEIITIEGRYWQSSTAQRAMGETQGGGWKNDPSLSGPSDALLDVAVHWVDSALFLIGKRPSATSIWRSYANAEAPHRDSHVQLSMDFENQVRAFASVSKTLHGATNHFEINVIGSRGAATWKFLLPDQIEFGSGSGLKVIYRKDTKFGSGQGSFHGLGWLEGYVEIFRQSFRHFKGEDFTPYPTLKEHLTMLTDLF